MQNSYDWEEVPELNITPLVDVMLVLLAILMLTAHAMFFEEKISVPKGSKSAIADDKNKLVVRVDVNKVVYVDDKKYDFSNFKDAFYIYTLTGDKDRTVLIRADKNLKYDDVIYVLKTIKSTGFQKISLLTDG
jgi:biopolymer transport protein ExbD